MGILRVCEEYKKLYENLLVAEQELELKATEWDVEGANMLEKVENLPF